MPVNLKTVRNIIIILLVLVFFVWHFFYYIDLQNNCEIKILPSFTEFSNLTMKRALKVLKYGTPEAYARVCANVDTISPNYGCGGLGGGCYYQNEPRTIYISTDFNDLLGTAAIMVHETCHAIQAKETRPFSENECYKAGDQIYRELTQY